MRTCRRWGVANPTAPDCAMPQIARWGRIDATRADNDCRSWTQSLAHRVLTFPRMICSVSTPIVPGATVGNSQDGVRIELAPPQGQFTALLLWLYTYDCVTLRARAYSAGPGRHASLDPKLLSVRN